MLAQQVGFSYYVKLCLAIRSKQPFGLHGLTCLSEAYASSICKACNHPCHAIQIKDLYGKAWLAKRTYKPKGSASKICQRSKQGLQSKSMYASHPLLALHGMGKYGMIICFATALQPCHTCKPCLWHGERIFDLYGKVAKQKHKCVRFAMAWVTCPKGMLGMGLQIKDLLPISIDLLYMPYKSFAQ